VPEAQAWPQQLVAKLASEAGTAGHEPPLELVGNLAISDFTTRDVIAIELPQLESLRPEVCSLLIGTNDILHGVGEDEFARNLNVILDAVEALVGRSQTFGVTSGNFSVAPAGPDHCDPREFTPQIRAYNRIFFEVCGARGIPVADIYDISFEGGGDPTLIASDGIHPSGAQYALWVERIAPVVRLLLERSDVG
jgi:lysophospholipase L1-like esterase